MTLEELASIPSVVLPVSEFAGHLHLGTGFADDGSQDAVLESYLRAAMAAIEARVGKALLVRTFSWTLTTWRDGCAQGLPIAPVQSISAFKLVDLAGGETIVPTGVYYLEKDSQRPRMVAVDGSLPSIPAGGTAVIEMQAGFGASWDGVPVDLAQAVFLLATHFYENRNGAGKLENAMPFGVMALIEPYRSVRVLGGGA